MTEKFHYALYNLTLLVFSPLILLTVFFRYPRTFLRHFLTGLSRAQPDWTLLQCPHAAELPALRWKLANLQTFSKRRPRDFEHQARALETKLG